MRIGLQQRRIVKRVGSTLRGAAVPEPEPAYWDGFVARVRLGVDMRRRRRAGLVAAVWSGAAAASLLVAFLLMRTPMEGAASVAVESDPAAAASRTLAASNGPPARATDPLESALDSVLGVPDLFEVAGEAEILSAEEKDRLIEILRAELEGAA